MQYCSMALWHPHHTIDILGLVVAEHQHGSRKKVEARASTFWPCVFFAEVSPQLRYSLSCISCACMLVSRLPHHDMGFPLWAKSAVVHVVVDVARAPTGYPHAKPCCSSCTGCLGILLLGPQAFMSRGVRYNIRKRSGSLCARTKSKGAGYPGFCRLVADEGVQLTAGHQPQTTIKLSGTLWRV
jgi:hypothetical protein